MRTTLILSGSMNARFAFSDARLLLQLFSAVIAAHLWSWLRADMPKTLSRSAILESRLALWYSYCGAGLDLAKKCVCVCVCVCVCGVSPKK